MAFITDVHPWCSLVGGFTILFHPLIISPNSDKNEISPYIITTCVKCLSHVMRIKEVITKNKMS